ncbi:MAG TPA: hypothetical protein VL551_33340 [Actinospica sp.]|nr:hypothetical protein [Actinospica sp.]
MSADHPNLVARVVAALHGEVSSATLESYRAAGAAVFQELAEVDAVRKQQFGDVPVGERSRRVAVWNALVPQVVAEALLDADYAAHPKTAGFVPPVTAEQAGRLFHIVEPWLAQARRADADPGVDLAAETALPAHLPAWVKAEPCPPEHLAAMVAAGRRMAGFAEAALADAERDPGAAKRLPLLRRLWAEADTAGRYAEGLMRPGASRQLHEAIEEKLHRALEIWFVLGQIAADPRLGEQPTHGQRAVLADPMSLPGGPSFNPWCLTDPVSRARWQADARAVRTVDLLWAYDPDPAATLTIQAEIDAALAAGDIATRTRGGKILGHYYCCPWSAVYEVRRPVSIAGQRLSAMEQFVFDVSAEEISEGGAFVRRVVRGPFHSTDEVDYCEPEGGHDE